MYNGDFIVFQMHWTQQMAFSKYEAFVSEHSGSWNLTSGSHMP